MCPRSHKVAFPKLRSEHLISLSIGAQDYPQGVAPLDT